MWHNFLISSPLLILGVISQIVSQDDTERQVATVFCLPNISRMNAKQSIVCERKYNFSKIVHAFAELTFV